MSYYILPKKNKLIDVNPRYHVNIHDLKPIVSFSLIFYFNELIEQICINSKNNDTEMISQLINPYEYIFTRVSGCDFSISKLNVLSNTFYCMMEMIHIFNLFDRYNNRNIKSLHFTNDLSLSTIECLNFLRENKEDIHLYEKIDYSKNYIEKYENIDLLYFELEEEKYNNLNDYVIGLIHILCNIFKYQNEHGVSIIKINDIYYKPILDIIYILTSNFEKNYIIKPSTSNILKFDKYIVCKNFNPIFKNIYLEKLEKILSVNSLSSLSLSFSPIISLISHELPYYFMNKVEEANIIIGHQQLESMEQFVNMLKNKYKEDKIEILKKNNIQKCIQFCEKFKIPYNSFFNKVNIFLPEIKKEISYVYDYVIT